MRYQFFTVRCADPVPDSERLNAFLAAHPILSVDRELIADGENSYWAFCIALAESGSALDAAASKARRGSRPTVETLPPGRSPLPRLPMPGRTRRATRADHAA